MLTSDPGALVKETKKESFKLKVILIIFNELIAQVLMRCYYICFLNQCPGV